MTKLEILKKIGVMQFARRLARLCPSRQKTRQLKSKSLHPPKEYYYPSYEGNRYIIRKTKDQGREIDRQRMLNDFRCSDADECRELCNRLNHLIKQIKTQTKNND